MRKSIPRLIMILTSFFVLLVAFTNCGEPMAPSGNGGPTNKSTIGFPPAAGSNGGGHSGKLTFVHSHLEERCDLPQLRLEVENGQTKAFTYGCNGETEDPFDINRLISFAHDPYFLVYDERIFAHESLMQQNSNERISFPSFCFNETYVDNDLKSRGISFAVRYSRYYQSPKAVVVTNGILVYGVPNSSPIVQIEEGRLPDPNLDGSQLYLSKSRRYSVQFHPPHTPTRSTGEIQFENGTRVAVECFHKEVIPEAR